MADDVGKFVSKQIAPLLMRAGFRRRGREFILDGPDGFLGVIGVYPDNRRNDGALAFELQYGVVPPALIEWRHDAGIAQRRWLSPSDALMRAFAIYPGWNDADPTDIYLYRWIVPETSPEDADAVGDLVRQAIRSEVLPKIYEWFDPQSLAKALSAPSIGQFPGMGPDNLAVAMALLGGGRSEELNAALAALPESESIRVWIEGKLDDR